jgi:hypothetical protein
MRPLAAIAALLLASTAPGALCATGATTNPSTSSPSRPALAAPATTAAAPLHFALQPHNVAASAAALMAAAASEAAATDPARAGKAFHLISVDDATSALDKVEAGATAVLEAKKAGLDAMEEAVRRHFDSKRHVAEQLFGDATFSATGSLRAGGVRGGGLIKSGATSAEGEGKVRLTSEEALAAAVHEAASSVTKGLLGQAT